MKINIRKKTKEELLDELSEIFSEAAIRKLEREAANEKKSA
jgi:hypothetical protein